MKKPVVLFFTCMFFSVTTIAGAKKTTSYDNDTLKNCIRSEGLFTLFRDTINGKVFLQIKKEQLGKEFIYFSFIDNAPLSSYLFRGSYYNTRIIRFDKKYDHIEVMQVNTGFYFDPNSPLNKASLANLNNPLLADEKIITGDNNSSDILVDADDLFANEKLQQVQPQPIPGIPPPALGSFCKDRSKIDRLRNYPGNTDLIVKLVYENTKPPVDIASLADGRDVTVYLQHSLVAVPENNFRPRIYDARVGYFANHVDDQTTLAYNHWRDIIQRWNLVKKDPDSPLSEPVKPIVFWIENTTPAEFRSCIKQAVESWNGPFEKAGFKNAIACKTQPDTASWDAGDINYNVIRWVSSPETEIPFNAYGPCFVNPRTGEILGADVILEFSSIRKSNFINTIIKTAAQQGRQANGCSLQNSGGINLQAGLAVMNSLEMGEAAKTEMIRQYIMQLVEHEVGHTFGLSHNFHGSTLLSPEEMKDPIKLAQHGTTSTAMDYPAFNINFDNKKNFLYYDTIPGIYDDWAIEFGYSALLKDAAAEATRLKKLLERSNDPRLAYGNDNDIMRGAGYGIDPDVVQFDNSNKPLVYAMEKCALYDKLFPKLKEKFTSNDQGSQELLNAYMAVMTDYSVQLDIICKQVGGVHFNHCTAGNANSALPLCPVAEAEQKMAMGALDKYAFSPSAFMSSMELNNYLLPQQRGLDSYKTTDTINHDPHLHDLILGIQKNCLDNLLNEKVLLRIGDSYYYGNKYTLDKFFVALTNSLFSADYATKVSSIRQNLQSEYITRLISIMDKKSNYAGICKSMALAELKHINKLELTAPRQDILTDAHRANIIFTIRKFFEEK